MLLCLQKEWMCRALKKKQYLYIYIYIKYKQA